MHTFTKQQIIHNPNRTLQNVLMKTFVLLPVEHTEHTHAHVSFLNVIIGMGTDEPIRTIFIKFTNW